MRASANARGSALVIVLVLIMILTASAGILVEVSSTRTVQTQSQRALAQARYLAETAIGMKIHQMNTDDTTANWTTALSGQTDEGRWRVTATLDGGGETAKGPYTIRGFGVVRVGEGAENVIVRAMEAKIQKPTVTTFTAGGAITVLGAGGGFDANFSGNSFDISGHDTNVDGTSGAGGSTYGISTDNAGATNAITTELGGS